ncbi:hypothetical protein [Sphingobium sp. YR768]|uniref:hypothetical protein n=1 Tax=Sphingobium sp. YR768 TaxID=1884365 RepID=UPI0008D150DD|nr:hypothetical protein [Sphingobium sp. YR768]SEQ69555.1 hypothetical protein SAMN05518866_102163 [Sphingobium sp. YR768]
MKADEPRPAFTKYGMPVEYADCIVQRHFDVLIEGQAIHAASMAHNMRVAPAMVAALERMPLPNVSAAAPALVQPVVQADEVEHAQDLRTRLGLS